MDLLQELSFNHLSSVVSNKVMQYDGEKHPGARYNFDTLGVLSSTTPHTSQDVYERKSSRPSTVKTSPPPKMYQK